MRELAYLRAGYMILGALGEAIATTSAIISLGFVARSSLSAYKGTRRNSFNFRIQYDEHLPLGGLNRVRLEWYLQDMWKVIL